MRGLSHYSINSSVKSIAKFILIALIVAFVGSAVYLAQAASQVPASGSDSVLIPQDSIRIRIIAQSDGEEDQAIKREVRDRISDLIVSWGEMPSTLPEARALIEARLPDIRSVTESALQEVGAPYGASIELADVPFPEKTFEGTVYPAADYEALRITLGDGEGANWWCVLFPPLCLTAATAKDDSSVAASTKAEKKESSNETVKLEKTNAEAKSANAASAAEAEGEAEKPKAKFFLAVLLEKLFSFLSSLF